MDIVRLGRTPPLRGVGPRARAPRRRRKRFFLYVDSYSSRRHHRTATSTPSRSLLPVPTPDCCAPLPLRRGAAVFVFAFSHQSFISAPGRSSRRLVLLRLPTLFTPTPTPVLLSLALSIIIIILSVSVASVLGRACAWGCTGVQPTCVRTCLSVLFVLARDVYHVPCTIPFHLHRYIATCILCHIHLVCYIRDLCHATRGKIKNHGNGN